MLRTGGFDDEGIYTKVLIWNLLEFTRIYFFGGDYTDSQSWAWGGMRVPGTGLLILIPVVAPRFFRGKISI